MATLEERLTQVENDLKQFKAETVKAYQDLTIPFAIVRGLAETSVGQIAVVRANQDEHSKKLEAINTHLNFLQSQVDKTDKRLDAFEQNANKRFDRLEELLTQIVARLPEQS